MGCLFWSLGLLLRVWATFCFYEHRMKVGSLEPQKALITTGHYGFSRNPLYLGGNVFIFFGAALSLGSPTALVITAIHIPLVDLFIRREERQLGKQFGEAWVRYKDRVRRWIQAPLRLMSRPTNMPSADAPESPLRCCSISLRI